MIHKFNNINDRESFRHCFIAWASITRGSAISIKEYCLSLSTLGHDVTLIVRGNGGNGGNGHKYKINNKFTMIIVKDRFKYSTKLSHIIFFIFVIKYIKNNRYDFIDVYNSTGMSILPIVLFFKKVKWILHIRTLSVQQGLIGLFRNFITRLEAIFFDSITVIDKQIVTNLIFWKKMQKSVVEFPLGVNPYSFNELQDERFMLFGEKVKNKKILIYLGKMDWTRRLDIMLDAFDIVLKDYKDCILVMVGEGDHLDILRKKARQKEIGNNVIFTGRVPYENVPKFLASADIAISYIPINKIYDYQPALKTMEYLQMGIPQVATNTAANRKYITHGYNGIIADDTSESFAKAISLILKERPLYKYIKHNCRDGLEAFYWDNIVKNFLVPFYKKINT